LPALPWIMVQTWQNLLFAHWPVAAEALRPLVPLPLDTFDGQAWVGVTPFYLTGLHPRGVPPLPLISHFPELNVRTYVTVDGKPGVWFFSLDAANLSAVWGARLLFHLPYFHARMTARVDGEEMQYRCARLHGPRPAEFHGHYRPSGPVQHTQPGTLEYFLTERYCLYAAFHGRLYCGNIHHLPWPLQPAEASIEHNTMAEADGIVLPGTGPLLHFARELKVLVWPPERIPVIG
jgi:uncharacterized protein YqjF (DUF2071 family)